MDKQPLISVIVPIYKVEEYLNQCIDSIVSQTYHNLEVILVDDGSPDNCPRICDEWAEKDTRIKVLHLQNGGAGKARNIGFSVCKGELVSFVDSDDVLNCSFYNNMLLCFKNDVDIVECDYFVFDTFFPTFCELGLAKKEEYDVNRAMCCHISDSVFKQIIWNKLYKRRVVDGVVFPEGKLIDDEFWTYQVIGRAKKLIHLKQKLYAYRQQSGSVMHKKYSILRLQALDAQYERLQYLQERYPSLLRKAKIRFLLACIYHGQMVQKFCPDNEKKPAMNKIKDYYRLVRLDKNELNNVKRTQRIWIGLAKNSLLFTCKLKNTLRIGL